MRPRNTPPFVFLDAVVGARKLSRVPEFLAILSSSEYATPKRHDRESVETIHWQRGCGEGAVS